MLGSFTAMTRISDPLLHLSRHGEAETLKYHLKPYFPFSHIYAFLDYRIPKNYFTYFYSVPFILYPLLCYLFYFINSTLSPVSIMFFIHCARRLYECVNVHVFMGNMTICGFLVGITHYVLATLTFMLPPHPSSSQLTNVVLFLTFYVRGTYMQHTAHVSLSLVPRSPSRPYPPLPRTPPFRYHSTPHYLGECMIYAAMMNMMRRASSTTCLLFVIANLWVSKLSKIKHRKDNTGKDVKDIWLWGGGWDEKKDEKYVKTKRRKTRIA